MTYVGSYTWDLRQHLGNRLLLLPGAQVLVIDEADRILFQRSRDTGRWGLPAGAAEPDSSFRTTAARELLEETGLQVDPDGLTPFASLSEPELHVVDYPNGDRVHCFALCFEARHWTGKLTSGDDEVLETRFFNPGELPEPLHRPTRVVLELHQAFLATGEFQAC